MRSAVTAASLLAFTGAALAQVADFDPIFTPTKDEVVAAGSTFEIKWETGSEYNGTVTIKLLGGPSSTDLVVVDTIATDVDNSDGSYEWSVSQDLGQDATYGIEIDWNANSTIFQYSFPFVIKADESNSTSSATAASSTVAPSTANSTATVTSTSSAITKPATAVSNSTATGTSLPDTVVTLTTTPAVASTTASTTSSPAAVTSNPASSVAASSLALVGGLAMAIFAL